MIGLLTGVVGSKTTGRVIVDVNGVGYAVTIPVSTFDKLPEKGSKVELVIHTHVREDNIQLFGFLTEGQKELFQMLISLSGVGPRVALTIISEISPEELSQIILMKNVQRLTAIPGIGKKTAERLVLEMKEKIKKLSRTMVATDSPVGEAGVFLDVASALTNLGYKQLHIDRAMSTLRSQKLKNSSFEFVLKQSLQLLRS